jgi:hypothetical protein
MYPGEPGRYTRGRVDPGEQTTGTRDEHYNLISVLYHALHGADNCSLYVMDAEAAGRDDLAAFFREAQGAQVGLAERVKELLGIGSAAPGAGGVPPGTASPETEIPPERMVGPEAPPADASPGTSAPETNR